MKDEIRDFLLARRARVSPGQAGIAVHGERRVAGLRREEVARLAGISVEYYIRLERGNARGFSDDVVSAVAGALRLDEAEREHLFDLVHLANARSRRTRKPVGQPVPDGVRRLLDAMATAPAYVWNGRLDILAVNPLGRALFAPLFDGPDGPVNQARFLFLDPAAPDFFPDWAQLAHDAVAVLRRTPQDRRLEALVGELSAGSGTFRDMWTAYDVRTRHTGVKRFRHPVAGPITVEFQSMALITDPDLRITAGAAEPHSASAAALQFLAGWSTGRRQTLTT